jgi:hypothetical protein
MTEEVNIFNSSTANRHSMGLNATQHLEDFMIRGKAISGAPSISGTSQFPKPPIINGIIQKIITEACAVTMT